MSRRFFVDFLKIFIALAPQGFLLANRGEEGRLGGGRKCSQQLLYKEIRTPLRTSLKRSLATPSPQDKTWWKLQGVIFWMVPHFVYCLDPLWPHFFCFFQQHKLHVLQTFALHANLASRHQLKFHRMYFRVPSEKLGLFFAACSILRGSDSPPCRSAAPPPTSPARAHRPRPPPPRPPPRGPAPAPRPPRSPRCGRAASSGRRCHRCRPGFLFTDPGGEVGCLVLWGACL